MKAKVINKGYTLEVVSWENDGDNYRTKSKTVESLDEAARINKICKELFCSGSNVGNSMNNEADEILIDYVKENQELFPDLKNDDEILDYFEDLGYELMGNSEYYDFRVCESIKITYSPEDIYLETIEFK